jgi:hypothetical protein
MLIRRWSAGVTMMALGAETGRGVLAVTGCGSCIYCYLGAPLNCHVNRGVEETGAGMEQVMLAIDVDAERCESVSDEVVDFLRLNDFFNALGVDPEFRLRLGKFILSVGMRAFMEQLVANAERSQRRLAEDGNREFNRVFGGETIVELEAAREM